VKVVEKSVAVMEWGECGDDDIDFEVRLEPRDQSITYSFLFFSLFVPFYTSLKLSSIMAKELSEENCYVALTHDHLDAKSMMDRVRSPKAGAIVLFAGDVSCVQVQIDIDTIRYNS
jgi:hypothetical protein